MSRVEYSEIRKALTALELGYLAGDVSEQEIVSARISADLLEKGGKRAQLNEIREWKGKKYKKTINGWIPVPRGRSIEKKEKETGAGAEKSKNYTKEDLEDLFSMAEDGDLPAGFDQWDLADDFGQTVAHVAAESGTLPKDFNKWDLANNEGWTVAHTAAMAGTLPADFKDWDLADNVGWTVAHEVVYNTHPPKGFDQWGLKDGDGATVAHVAAMYDHLPKDFNQWKLKDDDGTTVAAIAKRHGNLPKDFKG